MKAAANLEICSAAILQPAVIFLPDRTETRQVKQ